MDCIFCKIVRNEIKSYKIYEDEYVLAFLDINPMNKGHILVIPKKHYERLSEIPEEELKNFIVGFKKVLKIVEEKIAKDYNILVNNGKTSGQEIMHAHVHIIPRYERDEISIVSKKSHKLNEEEAREILKKIFG